MNIGKTKVMVCRCSNRPENIEVYYDGDKLDVVDTFTYLGVTLSFNASFYKAQKTSVRTSFKSLILFK